MCTVTGIIKCLQVAQTSTNSSGTQSTTGAAGTDDREGVLDHPKKGHLQTYMFEVCVLHIQTHMFEVCVLHIQTHMIEVCVLHILVSTCETCIMLDVDGATVHVLVWCCVFSGKA